MISNYVEIVITFGTTTTLVPFMIRTLPKNKTISLKIFLFVFNTLIVTSVSAQEDFYWWVEKHNWDGITPWNQYMTMSSAFLGPNALPVPEIKNGLVDTAASVNISFDHFIHKGDKTQDFYVKGTLPLFDNRISLDLSAVPLEWYEMDTITRDLRAVRTRSGKGSAGGDIYFSTCVQVIKNKKHLPDMLLRIALKTASGTHLRDARFTDAPGYNIDMSFGKSIFPKNKFIREIRFFADGGLYAYQTYDIQNLQNDCLLFGGGVTLNSNKFSWTNVIGGYSGYLNNGDKPIVFRSEFRILNKLNDFSISYENGLQDYGYQKFRVSYIFHIASEKIFTNMNN